MQSLKLSRQPSNIVRERSTLYFRQIIPKDLRHCWGKSSIKLSLKTGNVVKAKRKAAVMSAMIWDIFTALRKGDGRMTGLSTEELRALANSWLKEILEADEIDRMRGLTAEQRLFWRQEKDDSGNTVDLGYSQTVIEEIDKRWKQTITARRATTLIRTQKDKSISAAYSCWKSISMILYGNTE